MKKTIAKLWFIFLGLALLSFLIAVCSWQVWLCFAAGTAFVLITVWAWETLERSSF